MVELYYKLLRRAGLPAYDAACLAGVGYLFGARLETAQPARGIWQVDPGIWGDPGDNLPLQAAHAAMVFRTMVGQFGQRATTGDLAADIEQLRYAWWHPAAGWRSTGQDPSDAARAAAARLRAASSPLLAAVVPALAGLGIVTSVR